VSLNKENIVINNFIKQKIYLNKNITIFSTFTSNSGAGRPGVGLSRFKIREKYLVFFYILLNFHEDPKVPKNHCLWIPVRL
jgi:hypothetical protein